MQSHFNGPISRRSPSSPRCGCRACPAPALVSLCRFRAIFRRGPRPTFGSRPPRYDLFPFCRRFNTPQRGPRPLIRSVPGRYDSSPFVDLSGAVQTQAAPRPSRHGPAGKNATDNSKQLKPSAERKSPSYSGWPPEGAPLAGAAGRLALPTAAGGVAATTCSYR